MGRQIVRMQIELDGEEEGDDHEEFNEVMIGGEDNEDEDEEEEEVDEVDEPPSPDVPVAIVPPLVADDNDLAELPSPTPEMFVVPAPLLHPDLAPTAQANDTGDEYQTADEAETNTNAISSEAPSQRRCDVFYFIASGNFCLHILCL